MKSSQTLMTLNEARRVLNALAKLGITGDTLYARNPISFSGPINDLHDLNAAYMSEATILEQNLQETPLDYQIKMSTSLAPELDVFQQGELLKQGIEGWASLIAGRKNKGWQTGITRGEAFGMLFQLDLVRQAADAALRSL